MKKEQADPRSEIALFKDCNCLGDVKAIHKEEDICRYCTNGHVCIISMTKSVVMGEAAITVRRCLLFEPPAVEPDG